MSKYRIRWTVVTTYEAEVEAESPDDAFDMASEGVAFGSEREVSQDYGEDLSCVEVPS